MNEQIARYKIKIQYHAAWTITVSYDLTCEVLQSNVVQSRPMYIVLCVTPL